MLALKRETNTLSEKYNVYAKKIVPGFLVSGFFWNTKAVSNLLSTNQIALN